MSSPAWNRRRRFTRRNAAYRRLWRSAVDYGHSYYEVFPYEGPGAKRVIILAMLKGPAVPLRGVYGQW